MVTFIHNQFMSNFYDFVTFCCLNCHKVVQNFSNSLISYHGMSLLYTLLCPCRCCKKGTSSSKHLWKGGWKRLEHTIPPYQYTSSYRSPDQIPVELPRNFLGHKLLLWQSGLIAVLRRLKKLMN